MYLVAACPQCRRRHHRRPPPQRPARLPAGPDYGHYDYTRTARALIGATQGEATVSQLPDSSDREILVTTKAPGDRLGAFLIPYGKGLKFVLQHVRDEPLPVSSITCRTALYLCGKLPVSLLAGNRLADYRLRTTGQGCRVCPTLVVCLRSIGCRAD